MAKNDSMQRVRNAFAEATFGLLDIIENTEAESRKDFYREIVRTLVHYDNILNEAAVADNINNI